MGFMDYFNSVVELMDLTLSTKRKRHIVGGSMLGISLLFGVLALTVMTTEVENEAKEDKKDEQSDYDEIYR